MAFFKPRKTYRKAEGNRERDKAVDAFGSQTAYGLRRKFRRAKLHGGGGDFIICGNPPAGGPAAQMARHRHRRKFHNGALGVLQDGRCEAGRNLPRAESFFGRRASSGNFRLPSRLAEALEENPRRGGIRERMGAGRVAAHVRELPCEALPRPAAAAIRHGAPRPLPPALPIRQHARHLFLRRFRVF